MASSKRILHKQVWTRNKTRQSFFPSQRVTQLELCKAKAQATEMLKATPESTRSTPGCTDRVSGWPKRSCSNSHRLCRQRYRACWRRWGGTFAQDASIVDSLLNSPMLVREEGFIIVYSSTAHFGSEWRCFASTSSPRKKRERQGGARRGPAVG